MLVLCLRGGTFLDGERVGGLSFEGLGFQD